MAGPKMIMRKCDVMFLIRSMDRGGAERQLSLLARTLHAQGLAVCVAVFYAGGGLEHELRDAGIPVLDLEKSGRWSNLNVLRRLISHVRRIRPRVLHSYMSTQNVQALLLRPLLRPMGCSVVCGIRTSLKNAWRSDKATGIVDFTQSLLLSTADCVISNSMEAYRQWEKHCSIGKGYVIPNGIECQNYGLSNERRVLQRNAWRVEDEEILIGMVGRIDQNKNHELLLLAIDKLLSTHAMPVKIVFAGSGTCEAQGRLQERISAIGLESKVILAGEVSDLVSTYSAMDVFCLCSTIEGFPNVLAEAMCVGLPCISTDVGDARQVLGDCGWIVPPSDPAALGNAISEAIAAVPAWDRSLPRQRIIDNFSVDALALRTLSVLEPLLAGRRTGVHAAPAQEDH